MRQITTIRRGTKQHRQALAAARDVRCYGLGSGFMGLPIAEIPPYDRDKGKLLLKLGKYILHVHSNLWYEWAA
jgi:hypothetical protein